MTQRKPRLTDALPPVPDARFHLRLEIARSILLDALRVSWQMPTSEAEAVFKGGSIGMADFAVRTTDALLAALDKGASS